MVEGIEIRWGSGPVGDKIEIRRSINGGEYKKLKALNACDSYSYTDTSATKSGSTYSYQVRSFSKIGSVSFYSAFSQEHSLVKLNSPKISSVKNLDGGGFFFTFVLDKIGDLTADRTTCLDTEVGNSPVSVVYVVKTILDDGTVLSSDQIFIFRMPSPTRPNIYPTTDKSVDISWQYTGYFTGFQIQYTAGGKTKTVTVTDGMTYYHLKGLAPGNVYSFIVRTLLRIDGKTYYSDWCTPRTFAP